MQKFGVETESPEAKTASESTKPVCPVCGTRLAPSATTNVPICPRCGSEPFEAPP